MSRSCAAWIVLTALAGCSTPGEQAPSPGADDSRDAANTVNDPRIENRRWELLELNGQPVETRAGREGVFLELDSAQSRVTGNASCNRFSGGYELTAGNHLRFAPNMLSTMMACSELEREKAFLEALARVDNYTIGEGTLSLNRARMAPLARFRPGGE